MQRVQVIRFDCQEYQLFILQKNKKCNKGLTDSD